MFENIECEWPLFFELLLLDALIRGDTPVVKNYREKLESVVLRDEEEDVVTVPELYFVPEDKVCDGYFPLSCTFTTSSMPGVMGVPSPSQPGQGPGSQEAAHVVPVTVHPVWTAGG